MDQIQSSYDAVLRGDLGAVQTAVKAALDAGLVPEAILQDGLIAAMTEVGNRFEQGNFYVPEMLVAARAMQSGLALLRPHLVEGGSVSTAKILIGTVRGDLHDIGKNLVGMMLEGAGFEVVDLGNDVSPERFAAAAREHSPRVVGLSALLTTTMPNMRSTIEAIEDVGVRDKVKIIIGGAPVTEDYARQIGADGYAPDASAAVRKVRGLISP